MRVFLLGLFGAVVLTTVAVTPSSAFSIFGWTVFEDEAEAAAKAVIADPLDYTVDLSVKGDDTLDASVRGVSTLWTGRDDPASGAAGLLATARSDYRRIQSALYDAGYYGGTISIRVAGREAADLPPDTALDPDVPVVIRVETGPQFRFGMAQIVNEAPVPADVPEDAATADRAGFRGGATARAGAVRQAALLAVEAWRQNGHPKAEVSSRSVIADHDATSLDAVLTLDPGPYAVIGQISVDGADGVSPDFIIRQTGIHPGDEYDPDAIAAANERLRGLDLFTSIRIVEADAVDANGTLPLTVVVQERKPRRAGIGATFSTTEGLGLETYFMHRNLFGEGERLKLTAKLAGIGYPVNTAQFDYAIGGTFTKPGIITPDTDLVAEVLAQRTILPRYTETSVNAKLGLAQTFSSEISADAGLEVERSQFSDNSFGNRDFTLVGAYGTGTFDTRNNTTNPTRGLYASVTAEPFYEFNYGNAGLQLNAETRAYLPFGDEDRFVLAGRLRAGFIFGPSLAQTPPNRLFFAGGGGSVRGYSYKSIGVDGPGGTVTGGQFITEASVEARAKVTDDIGIVGFLDAGYVSANQFVDLSQGTRIGAGVGLRYYTGFGPLRLDFAVPLNKRAGDADYALYAGIGQAF